jgi:aryl-alcohol dehydrogenase-like predicted oxidoreductase
MIDKLCLGTVQFGLKYGIKNEIGRQPTNAESFSVMQTAIDSGITCFDTASVYGNAEDVLGAFDIGKYSVDVVSKLPPNLNDNGDVGIVKVVQKALEESCYRIKVKCLNGYLLHDAKDFYRDGIMKGLQICKDRGLVKNIGVSIYEPEDALNVVRNDYVDYIQIPYNVFDQRLDYTDFFEIAEKNQIKVFARSAFLQGLLLMKIKDIPNYLSIAKPYLKKFREIIENHGYSPAEAAGLFAISHKGIYKVVFGVDTKKQLEDNLKLWGRREKFKPCYDALHGSFYNIERKVIIPGLWKD